MLTTANSSFAFWRTSESLSPEGLRVLDFGCGAGRLVAEYRRGGYEAFGCDIVLEEETPELRRVSRDPYRLPFQGDCFDAVISDQVFEHVSDPGAAFREIHRVLRPGGVTLHIFPSRLRPVEPHVFVPGATVLHSCAWLSVWARLGIRNSFQRERTCGGVVAENHRYLEQETNYLTKDAIIAAIGSRFEGPWFVEREMLRHTYGRARVVGWLADHMPVIARLYSTFHMRAVAATKPRAPVEG